MVKELLPIVLLCGVWGHHALVHCHCDNQAVVACLHSRMCRDAHCKPVTPSHWPEYINTKASHLADEPLLISPEGPPSQDNSHPPPFPATESAPGPNPGLGLPLLAPAVQFYFQEGLAPSTRHTYGSAMKKINAFCTRYTISDPFPVTEHLLCCFAAYVHGR